MNQQLQKTKDKEALLTQAMLKSVLRYVRKTGFFYWKINRHPVVEGQRAGSFGGRYVTIKINQHGYMAHRLAWLYVRGCWPTHEIDHRNTCKQHNWWKNLREATRVQNACNAAPMKNKKYSSLKGITFAKGRKKWMASIRNGGKYSKLIGYFDTAQEAHAAYAKLAKQTRGKFARAA